MTQLFLDGMPAIPAANASIKLTSENPLYSDTTSYTYDVELPLDIPENRRIFGSLHRLDTPKEERELDARLMVDNRLVLTGKAHITSVTEAAVKVQLLGGSAAYNYRNKLDNLYIDELDLGDWESDAWDFAPWRPGAPVTPSRGDGDTSRPGKYSGSTRHLAEILAHDANGNRSDEILLANINASPEWVAYPVMNLTAGVRCNKHGWIFDPDAKFVTAAFRQQRYRQLVNDKLESAIPSLAVQPYVWVMAEKIAAATGATLPKNNNALYLDEEFFRRIFIVNANNFVDCARCLPHWSVNEWWSNLEEAFGVVVSFDIDTGEMRLSMRGDHFSKAGMTVISEVVDEYTVEMDDEANSDISSGNVGFSDFDGNNADLLTEKQRGAARVREDFADLAALLVYGKKNGTEAMKRQKDVLFQCTDGRRYIFTEAHGFSEVDQFRPRITDADKDVEISLQFVPAKYVDDEAEVYHTIYAPNPGATGSTQYPYEEVISTTKVKVLAVPDIEDMRWFAHSDGSVIDLEKLIADEEDPEISERSNGRDLCFIAISDPRRGIELPEIHLTYNHINLSLGKVPHPFGCMRVASNAALDADKPFYGYLTDGADREQPGTPWLSLSLNPTEGEANLGTRVVGVNGTPKINTSVRHCFKFIGDRIPDPSGLFLIRNRRFVCDKIEATTTPDGLNPLLTGYFYELDD